MCIFLESLESKFGGNSKFKNQSVLHSKSLKKNNRMLFPLYTLKYRTDSFGAVAGCFRAPPLSSCFQPPADCRLRFLQKDTGECGSSPTFNRKKANVLNSSLNLNNFLEACRLPRSAQAYASRASTLIKDDAQTERQRSAQLIYHPTPAPGAI